MPHRHLQTAHGPTTLVFISVICSLAIATATTGTGPRHVIHNSQEKVCPVILPQHTPAPVNQSTGLSSPVRSGSGNIQPRIVNGDGVGDDLRRYMVLLAYPSPSSDVVFAVCTGVLISRRVVLTAAHCISSGLVAVVGASDAQGSGQRIGIARSMIQPRYPSLEDTPRTSSFDIAFIELALDAPSGSRFMHVNVNPHVPFERSVVRVAGYGAFDETQGLGAENNNDNDLHQVDVTVSEIDRCAAQYGPDDVEIEAKWTLCAGYLESGKCDSCYGDSGGPLFQYDANDNPVLVGIVSSGLGCAQAGYPGIYVRVSSHGGLIPTDGVTLANVTVALDVNGSRMQCPKHNENNCKFGIPEEWTWEDGASSPSQLTELIPVIAGAVAFVVLAVGFGGAMAWRRNSV